MNSDILIFVSLQFINVIISTVKSVLTVEGSKLNASIINTISYTFGFVIMKLMTEQPMSIIVITSIVTNMIGVYFAKYILEKFKKEKLWVINTTILKNQSDYFENKLKENEISYTLLHGQNERMLLCIYAETKEQTKICLYIINNKNRPYTIHNSIH